MQIKYGSVEVVLEGEEFSDITDTAGYGIGYWCPKAYSDNDTYEVFYYGDPQGEPNDSGEEDDLTSTVVTPAMLGAAMAKILTEEIKCDRAIKQMIEQQDIDSYAADVIVQVAMFDRIIFG